MKYIALVILVTSASIFGMHHEKLDVIVFAIDLEIVDGKKKNARNFVSRITKNVENKEPQTRLSISLFKKRK